MKPLHPLVLALALLAVAVPAGAQVSSTSGSALGCTYTRTWADAAPQVTLTAFSCGDATCVWSHELSLVLPGEPCVPGDVGVEDGRACRDTAARAWRDDAWTLARERQCLGAEPRDAGACLVESRAVQDGRPAHVAWTCATVEGAKACRGYHMEWDYGGRWDEHGCVGVEVREEPCMGDPGYGAYLVVDDVTRWFYPIEQRLGCVAP